MDHQLIGGLQEAFRPPGMARRASRRLRQLVVITILAAPGFAAPGIWSRLSVSVAPGALLSLRGSYNSTATMKDIFIPGAGLGLILRYKLTPRVFLDAGYSYNWMFYRKETRPSDYSTEKPAWVLPSYTLNGTFFILSGRRLRPYVTLGGGLCPWWVSTRITGGTLLWFPGTDDIKFSKISWSVNSGAGIEVALGPKAAIFGEARYHHVFSRDPSRFGASSFTDQSLLGVRVGMTVYFGGDSH